MGHGWCSGDEGYLLLSYSDRLFEGNVKLMYKRSAGLVIAPRKARPCGSLRVCTVRLDVFYSALGGVTVLQHGAMRS